MSGCHPSGEKPGDRRERVFLDDADCCLFAPKWTGKRLAVGSWGPANRRASMNPDTKNGDMLGTDPFRGMSTDYADCTDGEVAPYPRLWNSAGDVAEPKSINSEDQHLLSRYVWPFQKVNHKY